MTDDMFESSTTSTRCALSEVPLPLACEALATLALDALQALDTLEVTALALGTLVFPVICIELHKIIIIIITIIIIIIIIIITPTPTIIITFIVIYC